MKCWLIMICGVIALVAPAQAEMYVAGLDNVEWSVGNASLTGNDLTLHTSVLYVAKLDIISILSNGSAWKRKSLTAS